LEWWDEGVAKPVDIGYDCAVLAWKHQAQTIVFLRQELRLALRKFDSERSEK
jgi:hypothetical protein